MKLIALTFTSLLVLCASSATKVIDGVSYNYGYNREKNGYVIAGSNYASAAIPVGTKGDIRVPSVIDSTNVVCIGEYAFKECASITSIVIPESVAEIGFGAFIGCTSLTNAVISSCVLKIPDQAFNGDVQLRSITLSSSLREIGAFAFGQCEALSDFSIPENVRKIGKYAFYKTGLRDVFIPEGVTDIESDTFQNCHALTNVVIASTVTNLQSTCFLDCDALSQISIPPGVRGIGTFAFGDCANLLITMYATNVYFEAYAFPIFKQVKFVSGFVMNGRRYQARSLSGQIGNSTYSDYVADQLIVEWFNTAGWVRWNACSPIYNVEYENTKGQLNPNPVDVRNDESVVFCGLNNLPGWDFAGWTPDRIDVGCTDDVVVSARWSRVYHEIAIDGVSTNVEYGTELTLSVPHESIEGETNRVCKGWVGTGDIPSMGTMTQVTFTVTQASSITWKYQTNFVVAVVANHGSVIVSSAYPQKEGVQWIPKNSLVYLSIPSTNDSTLVGWFDQTTSTCLSTNVYLSLCVTNPVHVCAEFCPQRPSIIPDSGTIFDVSQTISMSCGSVGATIHYTTDGTTPTMESPIYKKFRIYGKTTIKVIAFYDDGVASAMSVSEYALGRCEDPVIRPGDGSVFQHSGQMVSIMWVETNGILRCTLDGSEPTESSPEYTGSFSIDATTTVKAKVFSDTHFDSGTVTSVLTREWVSVATPVIEALQTFTGTKNKVKISCATGGASIYYTTDGSTPTIESTRYEKPFCVTESCTIKAVAVMVDYLDSDIAMIDITRVWSIGETMGKPDHAFATAGNVGFVRTMDATAALGESMRSGTVKNSQTSILSTVVVGPGVLSFKWKTSCEEDYPLHGWDHAEFVVDGEVVGRLDGITEWQQVNHLLGSGGVHEIEWRYVKDESEYEGEDCMWVSEYLWNSDYTETQTTDDPVPYSWLTERCCDVVDEYDSYEKVAKQMALNGRLTVEQCYVAGIDPESATNDFRAIIKMIDGGPKVTWAPDLKGAREYKIWGKANLDDGSLWQYPTNAFHRFFKVMVELP